MPDVFAQRRDEHLKKSQAFLQEASNLFRDDLLYRSALADAVSAIKHSLQAYLWLRVGEVQAGEQRQRWQEVALEGSMPQLLRAAAEAGLPLHDADRAIRELNDLRNQRTHDSPRSPITPEQAARAVQIARTIRDRVIAQAGGPAARPAVAARTGVRAGDTVHVAPGAPPSTPPTTTATAPATSTTTAAARAPAPAATAVAPEPASEDDTELVTADDALPARRTRGRRHWRLLGLAAALVVGLLAGSAVTYPVASGRLPVWIPYASRLAPATATPAPTPTPAAIPTEPAVAGALQVAPSACGVTPPTVTLHNTGATPLSWAAGSPDRAGSVLAVAPSGSPHPTLTGRLLASASLTLDLVGLSSGAAHVVVIADGGTVEVALGLC
jgi:hypothetical protein